MTERQPFIGRKAELRLLREILQKDSQVNFIPVIGPSGCGKSEFLKEAAKRSTDWEAVCFRYEMKEPQNVQQFLSRVEQSWENEFPNSLVQRLRERVSWSSVANLGQAAIQAGSGRPDKAVKNIMDLSGPNNEPDNIPDPARTIAELSSKMIERKDVDHMLLIFDQYDPAQLEDDIQSKFDSIFKSLPELLPDEVICCIGTQERFYNSSSPEVNEIPLSDFSVEEVQEYAIKMGFRKIYVEEIYEETSGNPFYTWLLLKTADMEGEMQDVLSDLSSVRNEKFSFLQEKFLASLTLTEQKVLRQTCALPYIRPDIVNHLTEFPQIKVNQILEKLHKKAVIEKVGFYDGIPIYSCHELQQEFLRERSIGEKLTQQHVSVAGYYIKQMVQNAIFEDITIFFSEKGSDKVQRFMAAGYLFDYHLHQIQPESRLEDLLEKIIIQQDITESEGKKALYQFYNQIDFIDFEGRQVEKLEGISSERIVQSIKQERQESVPQQTLQQMLEQVAQTDELSSRQQEFARFLLDTFYKFTNGSEDEFDREMFLERRIDMSKEFHEFEDVSGISKLSEVALCFILAVTIEPENPDFSQFWRVANERFGFNREKWDKIKECSRTVGSSFFTEQTLSNIDKIENESTEEEVEEKIDSFGMFGGLQESVSGPWTMIGQFMSSIDQSPKNFENAIDSLEYLSSYFLEENNPVLSALCKDISDEFLRSVQDTGLMPVVLPQVWEELDIKETRAAKTAFGEQVILIISTIRLAMKKDNYE